MHSVFLTAIIVVFEALFKEKRERDKQEKEYLNGHVHIMTYHNYGAFLNSGEKNPLAVKLVSVLLTLAMSVVFILTFTKYGNRGLRIGLSFLLGGAFSNTYDRIKRGYVVDYLNFPKLPGKIKNVVFNFSDFCILIGSCIILIKQK